MEVFTLTHTLSLKEREYLNCVSPILIGVRLLGRTPSLLRRDQYRSNHLVYRMEVGGCAGLLAGGQAEETVFHAISCRSNQAKGPGLCPGLVLFPRPGCGLGLRVLLFLAVMGHQGASVAVWISSCGKRMGICVTSLYDSSTNVRKKGGRWGRVFSR